MDEIARQELEKLTQSSPDGQIFRTISDSEDKSSEMEPEGKLGEREQRLAFLDQLDQKNRPKKDPVTGLQIRPRSDSLDT